MYDLQYSLTWAITFEKRIFENNYLLQKCGSEETNLVCQPPYLLNINPALRYWAVTVRFATTPTAEYRQNIPFLIKQPRIAKTYLTYLSLQTQKHAASLISTAISINSCLCFAMSSQLVPDHQSLFPFLYQPLRSL